MIRGLYSVSRVTVNRLLPVYSWTRRGRVAWVGLSESPAVGPMRGHVVRLIRWSHVCHVGGVVTWWVLAWIVHWRPKPGVIGRRRGSSRRRTVES